MKYRNKKRKKLPRYSVLKSGQKYKSKILNKKIIAELDYIKSTQDIILSEIRKLKKEIVDEIKNFFQGHSPDSEYIEVNSAKDYLNDLIPKYQDLSQSQDKSDTPI
jgi:hypothetical protein